MTQNNDVQDLFVTYEKQLKLELSKELDEFIKNKDLHDKVKSEASCDIKVIPLPIKLSKKDIFLLELENNLKTESKKF